MAFPDKFNWEFCCPPYEPKFETLADLMTIVTEAAAKLRIPRYDNNRLRHFSEIEFAARHFRDFVIIQPGSVLRYVDNTELESARVTIEALLKEHASLSLLGALEYCGSKESLWTVERFGRAEERCFRIKIISLLGIIGGPVGTNYLLRYMFHDPDPDLQDFAITNLMCLVERQKADNSAQSVRAVREVREALEGYASLLPRSDTQSRYVRAGVKIRCYHIAEVEVPDWLDQERRANSPWPAE